MPTNIYMKTYDGILTKVKGEIRMRCWVANKET